MKTEILVIHERGAPEHYLGLEAAAEQLDSNVRYVEFSVFRMLAKALIRHDASLLKRVFRNVKILLPLILGRKWSGAIVLGIAPFDPRMLLLSRIIRNNEVYIHSSWPYWDLSFQPYSYRTGFVLSAWKSALQRWVTGMYFVTDECKRNFERSQFAGVQSSVVYHSYEEKIYKPNDSADIVDKNVLHVGYVGRLESVKGIGTVLELARRNYKRKVVFKIAGIGSLQSDVEAAVKEKEGVEYLGYISDKNKLAEFYNSLDILLVPSQKIARWEELFGMVIIESMACGVFPIATDHVGPREIINRAGFGHVVAEDSYVEVVSEILETYPEDVVELKARRQASVTAAKPYGRQNISQYWLKQLK